MNDYDGESKSYDSTENRNFRRRGHYSALRKTQKALRFKNVNRTCKVLQLGPDKPERGKTGFTEFTGFSCEEKISLTT